MCMPLDLRDIGFSGAGVISNFELPSVSARNQIQVL